MEEEEEEEDDDEMYIGIYLKYQLLLPYFN
jgi:hypothetical protein